MKEIKLTNDEMNQILDRAIGKFNDKSPISRGRGFLAACVLESALELFKKKGYIVKYGKIYK